MMNNKVSLPPISDILNSSMLPLPLPTTNVNRYTMPLPSLSLPPMSSVSLSPGHHHHNYSNNAPNNHINHIDHSNNGQRTPPSLTSYTTTNNLSRISSISSSSSPVPSTSILNYSSLPNYQYPSKPPAHATTDKKIELPSKITVNEVSSNEKRKTRNNLPKETTYILLKWLNDHLNHPYPNNFEKNQLMMSTGLNQQQLSNWFINARRRKIKMLKQQYSIEI